MSKVSLAFGVIFALSLCVHDAEAARMVAKRVTAHQRVKSVLSEKQKQNRKASEAAEADLICRKAEVKQTINADLTVNGVSDINWDTVKATAADGMKLIEKSIADYTREIGEKDAKIKELEEANKWGEVSDADVTEMLHASCESFSKDGYSGCDWAVEGNCGWMDPALEEAMIMEGTMPPFDEPIAKFRAAAEAKINGYSRLAVESFRKQCAAMLMDKGADMCFDLCHEYTEIVRELGNGRGAQVLGNTDTIDSLKAERAVLAQKLADAQAEKEACATAQTDIEAFRAQLAKLSSNYKGAVRTVGTYKRMLRMREVQLRRQIMILEQKKKLLERAKLIFAAAVEQVKQRQADVDHMQAVLDDLLAQLKAQIALIAEIEQKISEIEAATETGALIKTELSRILNNAQDTHIMSIHKPLEGLKITADKDIAADFDAAEEGAAPAMKSTVRAVADYCGKQDTSEALTSPLIKLAGQEKELNFICAGQDWNDMIAEAQSSVKATSKAVVDALKVEQQGVIGDTHVPKAGVADLRAAHGEPRGLRHGIATFGGKGSFFDSYLNPGWTVEVADGAVSNIGKMLMLYQKLGEAAELMQAKWDEAEAHRIVLVGKVDEAEKELARLTELLNKAIAAKEIAEANMNEAQKVVDENQALKDKMQEVRDRTKKSSDDAKVAEQAAKEALMKEHTDRAAALVEILQRMK